MPDGYPPHSVSRHSSRRSSRGRQTNSSYRASRNQRVMHEPFAGQNEKSQRGRTLRNHLIAMSGEFIGTVLFLWFAFAGTGAASAVDPVWSSAKILLISLNFGISLAVVAWAFYRISGGLFNPAVTLAMMVTGTLPIVRGLLLIPAQLIGGIVAAALVDCMFPGGVSDVILKLGTSVSIAQGVFIEMFLTSILVFTILMLAAEKHLATFVAPVGIGLALFIAMMAGVYYTGGGLNPARAFGPCVVARSFPGYHYIYWAGPVMGALLSGLYYKFVKYFNYEEANPGQDDVRG